MVSLDLATLASIVLLPIIPAYFLFKALPSSTASVTGPLQGLQLKLGGAFAGYFAVLLLITYTHSVWAPPPAFQVWEVSGQVTDDTGAAIDPLYIQDVALDPPTFQPSADGTFKLTFSTVPAPGGGVDYPTLTISHPSYGPVMISLQPSAKGAANPLGLVSDGKQKISIPHIALHKLPAYTATGPAPVAIPAASESHQ
jgi:hypothetical protein